MSLASAMNDGAHGHIHELLGGTWSRFFHDYPEHTTNVVMPFLHDAVVRYWCVPDSLVSPSYLYLSFVFQCYKSPLALLLCDCVDLEALWQDWKLSGKGLEQDLYMSRPEVARSVCANALSCCASAASMV